MKETEKVSFDKLDYKIFKEIPFLIDTIAAWGNKIKRILDPLSDEIEEIIETGIKGKRFWKIESVEKNIFYPFKEDYSTQNKIQSLDGYFIIYNYFRVGKIIKTSWKNYFIVEFGYWLQTKDDENNFKMNSFYCSLCKGDDFGKIGGIIKNVDFYKSIKRKNKDKNFDFDISHPDLDGKPESIEIRCSERNPKKIDDMYEVFKDQVLLSILKSIK